MQGNRFLVVGYQIHPNGNHVNYYIMEILVNLARHLRYPVQFALTYTHRLFPYTMRHTNAQKSVFR